MCQSIKTQSSEQGWIPMLENSLKDNVPPQVPHLLSNKVMKKRLCFCWYHKTALLAFIVLNSSAEQCSCSPWWAILQMNRGIGYCMTKILNEEQAEEVVVQTDLENESRKTIKSTPTKRNYSSWIIAHEGSPLWESQLNRSRLKTWSYEDSHKYRESPLLYFYSFVSYFNPFLKKKISLSQCLSFYPLLRLCLVYRLLLCSYEGSISTQMAFWEAGKLETTILILSLYHFYSFSCSNSLGWSWGEFNPATQEKPSI